MTDNCVSIIIPTYNRANIIGETIQSVIDQTYTNWDCVIVDDGSIDNTDKVVARFVENHENIRYFKRHRLPKGVSTSRNIGINKSIGEYIIFLDSDDLLDVNCLNNRMTYSHKNPDCDFWIFKMQQFEKHLDNKMKVKNRYTPNNSSNEYMSAFFRGKNPFSVTSPLWRKNALEKLNGFDERLHLWEDPELHIRAIDSGLRFSVDLKAKPDCYNRIDICEKQNLHLDKNYLSKLYYNTYIYYKRLIIILNRGNESKLLLKKDFLYNAFSFFKNTIVEKRNLKQFFIFYFLLVRNGLIYFRLGLVLNSWFLFHYFRIKGVGSWNRNTLRKRVFYSIDAM